jgi:hypothetical protein
MVFAKKETFVIVIKDSLEDHALLNLIQLLLLLQLQLLLQLLHLLQLQLHQMYKLVNH